MGIMQAFKMSFKSISSNKVRTVLTMLGIIIGVAAVIILVSLVRGYTNRMMEYYRMQGENRIEVYAYQWNDNNISQDLYDYCVGLDDLVDGVTQNASVYSAVKYKDKKNEDCNIYLGSDKFTLCNNYVLDKGRDLSYMDVKKYKKVCLLGSKAAEVLFNYEDPLGKEITIGNEPFMVIGVYKQKFDESLHMDYYDNVVVAPYTSSRFMADSYISFDSFIVKAKDSSTTTEAVTKLSGFLNARINQDRGYFNVYSSNQAIESGNEETRMLSLILGGIAGIALLVGGIGIMNIMLVTVTERTREIGIRKALGARRKSIVGQFLIESGVISFAGGIIGILIGMLVTLVLGKVLFDMVIFPDVMMSVGAAAFSIVLGIIFGIYPAAKASGLQPVDALRSE